MILRPEHVDTLLALEGMTRPYGEMCRPFAPLVKATKLDLATVRRCCRYLAKRGLAEYHRALWTEEGELAGAGYCITTAGQEKLKSLFPSVEENPRD